MMQYRRLSHTLKTGGMQNESDCFYRPKWNRQKFSCHQWAHQHGCDGIIDDGLLIEGTKILAGKSAKTEQNKVQAVKRAIFMEKDHCDEVKGSYSA